MACDDFDTGGIALTRSRFSDATWTAFTEALRFIVIPLVLVDLITNYYPELQTAFLPDIEMFIIFFGGMITAASTLEVSYRPGSYHRVLYGLSALAFLCMWIFIILGGGVATFRYGPYFIHFDMSKIVYIMLFGISLKALLVFATFSANRANFLSHVKETKTVSPAHPPTPHRTRVSSLAVYPSKSFETMSKVAYDVTPDEGVGSSTPRSHAEASGRTYRPPAQKECPICGAKATMSEKTCKSCGAWF